MWGPCMMSDIFLFESLLIFFISMCSIYSSCSFMSFIHSFVVLVNGIHSFWQISLDPYVYEVWCFRKLRPLPRWHLVPQWHLGLVSETIYIGRTDSIPNDWAFQLSSSPWNIRFIWPANCHTIVSEKLPFQGWCLLDHNALVIVLYPAQFDTCSPWTKAPIVRDSLLTGFFRLPTHSWLPCWTVECDNT